MNPGVRLPGGDYQLNYLLAGLPLTVTNPLCFLIHMMTVIPHRVMVRTE